MKNFPIIHFNCAFIAIYSSVGGIRASLYNAITEEETRQLSEYMKEFMVTFKTEEWSITQARSFHDIKDTAV